MSLRPTQACTPPTRRGRVHEERGREVGRRGEEDVVAAPWGLFDARTIPAGSASGDAAAMRIAAGQDSLITSAQLRFVGLSRDAIATRIRRGLLTPVHRGVYLMGPAELTDRGRCAAAVLACGPHSVLSHHAAAYLWRLLELPPGTVDLTILGRRRGHRPGLRVHDGRRLDRRDLRRRDGLPLTSPPLTLLGLAETATPADLTTAIDAARRMRIVRREELLRLRARTPGRHGWARLRPFLEQGNDDFSRSAAEDALAALIVAAGLPAPRRNVRAHGHELDFYWPELGLNVEVDGYEWHSARGSLNADRERDGELAAHDVWVIRFTRDGVRLERERTLARLAAAVAIAERRARGI